MIVIADSLRPGYADMKALAASMIGALQIEMRAKGWTGAFILDADYHDDRTPPALVIEIGPGHSVLSVETVSTFIKEKRVRRRAEAESGQ